MASNDPAESEHPADAAHPLPGEFDSADENTTSVPATSTTGTMPVHTPSGQAEPAQAESGKRTRSELPLWIWPGVLIVVMAVSGQFFGPLGVLLAGVGLTATLVLFTGGRAQGFPRNWLLPINIGVGLLFTAALLAAEYGMLTNRPVGASTSIFPRGLPSAEQLRNTPSPGAALPGIKLDDQNLRGARLEGASAPGASLEEAILEDTKLAGADFRGANLRGARLSGADLRGVNFTGADLRDAVLTNTCLRGADLTGAVINDLDATGAAVEDAVISSNQISAAKAWPASTPSVPGACPR